MALVAFVGITFLITWGLIGVYILFPDTAATWGLWHLPAFFLSNTVFANWGFLPFFVGNVVLAVLVTPIFNQTQGSLLWPMLFHWQLINPFWPDAQPWDTWILVAVAAIILWWNRDTMFRREGAVTEVVPTRRHSGD